MPKSILHIKNSIHCHVANPILLKPNRPPNKTIKPSPILKQTYPSLFILHLHQHKHNFQTLSYTYTHLLTQNLQLSFQHHNHHQSIPH
ncbi:Veg family protein [Staphylococcus aureus]|uniref:Veg family protein n=1 Tax=Staphylococcus aureus TaxID=1280 RepID=UPI0011A303C2|nr:Veg family protein [Staphylococcus aureus]